MVVFPGFSLVPEVHSRKVWYETTEARPIEPELLWFCTEIPTHPPLLPDILIVQLTPIGHSRADGADAEGTGGNSLVAQLEAGRLFTYR